MSEEKTIYFRIVDFIDCYVEIISEDCAMKSIDDNMQLFPIFCYNPNEDKGPIYVHKILNYYIFPRGICPMDIWRGKDSILLNFGIERNLLKFHEIDYHELVEKKLIYLYKHDRPLSDIDMIRAISDRFKFLQYTNKNSDILDMIFQH